jgi:CubicO group peptidase (beta-lactamase class C family)
MMLPMISRKRLVAALLASLASTSIAFAGPVALTAPEDVGMSSAQLDRLKHALEQLLEEERTGGFQVLVARHGKVVMHENLGMADIEAGRPITDDTLFRIASMTKPIVGVAMMMLYEEGVFSLQDPVAKHIPEFANLQVFTGMDGSGNMQLRAPARPPTIHDLMQHTAGFTYGIFSNTPVDQAYLNHGVLGAGLTQQEFIETVAELPLLFDPGMLWNYSIATDIQGYLIEKWTGMELGAFLRERIFEPLGMDETMAWVPADRAQHLASVYSHDASGELVRTVGLLGEGNVEPARFSGGGQLISTSDDYWRFCQMLLNGGQFNGRRLLSPKSIAMMSENRLDAGVAVTVPGWIDRQGFGLNFSVITDSGKVDFPANEGEYFWAGAVTTLFWIDPAEDIVTIMMTQYDPFLIGEYSDLVHRFVNTAVVD